MFTPYTLPSSHPKITSASPQCGGGWADGDADSDGVADSLSVALLDCDAPGGTRGTVLAPVGDGDRDDETVGDGVPDRWAVITVWVTVVDVVGVAVGEGRYSVSLRTYRHGELEMGPATANFLILLTRHSERPGRP